MSPGDAAVELFDLYGACADVDLAGEISRDLAIDPAAAEKIAAEIVRRRKVAGVEAAVAVLKKPL